MTRITEMQDRINNAQIKSEQNSARLKPETFSDVMAQYKRPIAFLCGVAGFVGLGFWIANIVQ